MTGPCDNCGKPRTLIQRQAFGSKFYCSACAEKKKKGGALIRGPLHVMIEGPQGSGKTTLARAIGNLLQEAGVSVTIVEDGRVDSATSLGGQVLIETSQLEES